jgi:uncharacterized membrane protein YfcA
MLTMKTWLFVALGAVTLFYLMTWFSAIRRPFQNAAAKLPAPREGEAVDFALPFPSLLQSAIGFIANFFDTLGIGSFATTTAMFRAWKQVRDEVIPGTLNVGHTLPTITQAFIYIAIVEVDMTTLIALIIAAVLGMWLGAGIVAKLPRRVVQIGMGIALLVAASLTLMAIFNKQAGGGEALALTGGLLVVGIIGNFVLGSLMSLGIGLYGPCLIMISLLGMNPKAAFPIMMGSCAFLMPTGSLQFIRKGSYNLRAALGLALGGVPAVLIAAFLVKSMDLLYVRWLVVIVVVYTALSLLRSAMVERDVMTAPKAEA